MKLLLISNMYPSVTHANYGIFVQNFERGIKENGGLVRLAVIKGRGRNFLEKFTKYSCFIYDVIISVLRNNYDVVYVHYIGHSLLPLVIISKFIKKPLVINAHGDDVLSTSVFGLFIQRVVSFVIRRADLVVVPSYYFKAIVSQKFSLPNDKIFVSPSGGVDTKLFSPPQIVKPVNMFTIGYVSRVDEGKGWDTLLLAASELNQRYNGKFKITMIGGGKQVGNLQKLVDRLGISSLVEYLGPLPQNELPQHYRIFDLFVFPTRLVESLGLVGIEAMACGVPVIGSDIGGLKEYIKNGENGFLFEAGNHLDLASKIENFIHLSDSERNLFRQSAINTSKYYESRIVDKKLYKKLTNICCGTDE